MKICKCLRKTTAKSGRKIGRVRLSRLSARPRGMAASRKWIFVKFCVRYF